jgi:hypothetical protein
VQSYLCAYGQVGSLAEYASNIFIADKFKAKKKAAENEDTFR